MGAARPTSPRGPVKSGWPAHRRLGQPVLQLLLRRRVLTLPPGSTCPDTGASCSSSCVPFPARLCRPVSVCELHTTHSPPTGGRQGGCCSTAITARISGPVAERFTDGVASLALGSLPSPRPDPANTFSNHGHHRPEEHASTEQQKYGGAGTTNLRTGGARRATGWCSPSDLADRVGDDPDEGPQWQPHRFGAEW